MTGYDPGLVAKVAGTQRWSVLARTGLTAGEIGTWDPALLRDPRLLVPIDVQALVAAAGSTEPVVRMLSALRAGAGQPPFPAPFDPGAPREPGVHLHWALPDALMRGRIGQLPDGADPTDPGQRLQMSPAPDRWAVVRLLCPAGSDAAVVTGWVIEADTARAVPFPDYPAQAGAAAPAGVAVPPGRLTPVAGGNAAWAASYDGTLNRFAFHDPLDDLDAIRAARGELLPTACYVVAGWWSGAGSDPLDGARSGASLHALLADLGWRVAGDAGPVTPAASAGAADRLIADDAKSWLGLTAAQRYPARPDLTTPAAAGRPGATDHLTLAESTGPYQGAASALARAAGEVIRTPVWQTPATLLHGSVLGVPLDGSVAADARPDATAARIILGVTPDDLIAGLIEPGLAEQAPEQRRAAEMLVGAFGAGALKRLGTPDGLADTEQREHAVSFTSAPSGEVSIDRLLAGQAGVAGTVGSRGRTAATLRAGAAASAAAPAPAPAPAASARLVWARALLPEASAQAVRLADRSRMQAVENAGVPPAQVVTPPPQVAEVSRPGPRWFTPLLPSLAVSGAGRSLRHGYDGRFSPDGALQCRWPSQVQLGADSIVSPQRAVPALGSAAVPPELLALAREALVTSPHAIPWLSAAAASHTGTDATLAEQRLLGEAALRYGANAAYTSTTTLFTGPAAASSTTVESRLIAQELRRFSLFNGVDADPVGVTAWTQPWIPLWLEWQVEVDDEGAVGGWQLGGVDLVPPDGPPGAPATLVCTGRSLLAPGPATGLSTTLARWLDDEHQRDLAGVGQIDDATYATLSRVRDLTDQLDVVSAALEGLREQLLGLPWDNGLVRAPDGSITPAGLPRPLLAGRLRLTRARLVDAFGRLLDLPVDTVQVPTRVSAADDAAAAGLPPRLLVPSRAMFRFVDAASTGERPAQATIDEVTPAAMISPVAGFLLPDHIDESLEAFDPAGTPLGQLFHEAIGGGVVWEIAPGRDGPVDAGPGYGLSATAASMGWFAAGLVAADLRFRRGGPQPPGGESALSALLRAIDTTLWSYDPFAVLGTEHVAGLVGRPLAVVRARLWLEIKDDVAGLAYPDDGARAARQAAYDALAVNGFPVRVGELTRADDGLMAFFVGDDFTRVRVVDKVVLELAREAGRHKGYLGPLRDHNQDLPPERPIAHPYVVADDELRLYPGATITLTLLMHPAGAVNLTTGIVPRKALQLARDWVGPGLSAMSPYVRSGPVLLDPDKVRLPRVAALAPGQVWTRRDSASSWRDDPILAATQAALLPELPARVEEGYIRVLPGQDGGPSAAPAGGP
ncbi:MAG: hypothetical protein QOG05_4975 [Streptosporangiaceae bacterium]|nr:hypothetical protein [Streptosporangiaceae bacterium]